MSTGIVMRGVGSLTDKIAVSDCTDLFGNSRITDLSLSTTAAQSAAIGEGVYDVWSDMDCYVKIHSTANDVTTSTGYLLRANNTVPLYVRGGHKIGAILASGTGTLSSHRVG